MKYLQSLIIILLIVLTIFAVGAAFVYGLGKEEIHKCIVLQQHSEKYQGFYITPYEKEMCEFHHMYINASIK